MGKRFFISLLMIVVIVGGIAFGSAMIFSSQYDSLMALERSAEVSPEVDTLTGLQMDTEDSEDDQEQIAVIFTDGTESVTEAERPSMLEDYSSQIADATAQTSNTTVSSDTSSTRAKAMLEDMTLEEKIYQMLFVTPEALTGYSKVTQSGNVTKNALALKPVGGIIYFSSNLISVDQTVGMISAIQEYSLESTGRGLFIGVDEEGGSVARVADTLGTTEFDDMAVYGEAGDTDAVYDIGVTQAEELTALGFNVNFSPVADVLTNEDNTVVADRSFGSDPQLVADMVTQVVKGLTDGGMLCAPKHFPGHGSTGGDTHNGFAASEQTAEDLETCDLVPFQAAIAAGAPMIMVGHMTMTEIDPDHPASLSSTIVTGILREKLGYDGIIITDAMNMSAITDTYSYAEATVAAIAAGCDMVLCVSNITDVVSAVERAVEDGTIQESSIDSSVLRILTAKYRYGIIP